MNDDALIAEPRGSTLSNHRIPAAGAEALGRSAESSLLPGEFYFDRNNLMVFTAAYLERRGYCCNNGCRHCPYPKRQ